MSMIDYANDKAALEQLVDRNSLETVLAMLASIAYEKSSHIRERFAWLDDKIARHRILVAEAKRLERHFPMAWH